MKKLLYISVLFLFGMTSCIQDYLDDGGTHSAESNTTPYEYLSSHTYHMFDTLIQIIDHYGLEEEMNRAATVFACSDFSVKALLKKRSDQLADEHGGPIPSTRSIVILPPIRSGSIFSRIRSN